MPTPRPLNFAKYSADRLFVAALFSLLTAVRLGAVAYGDFVVAPSNGVLRDFSPEYLGVLANNGKVIGQSANLPANPSPDDCWQADIFLAVAESQSLIG